MVDKPWEEGAIKVIRKAQFLLYLFIFTLEIVGYFIFFPKSVAPSVLQNYHQF
jgi:hypothetical protein